MRRRIPIVKESHAAHRTGHTNPWDRPPVRVPPPVAMTTAAGEHTYRYLIVGAGPGGLQLSYFLHRAGADYLTLEREAVPGSFFRRYPRHRRLISLNKVNSPAESLETALRWDWNSLLSDSPGLLFPRYSQEYFPSADDLVRYLADFQRVHALNV